MSVSINTIAIFLSIFGPVVFIITAAFTISDLQKREKAEKEKEANQQRRNRSTEIKKPEPLYIEQVLF